MTHYENLQNSCFWAVIQASKNKNVSQIVQTISYKCRALKMYHVYFLNPFRYFSKFVELYVPCMTF